MNAPLSPHPLPPYKHTPLFPLGADTTTYRKLTAEGVRVETILGREVLVVSHEAMRALSEAAFTDINHLFTFADMYDRLHPTRAAYDKLGDAWYQAIQPVPEPTTASLFTLAIAMLGSLAIHRRKVVPTP